jgi:hypothetical protein
MTMGAQKMIPPKVVVLIPVVMIIIIGAILMLPGLISNYIDFSMSERTNILLTLAITVFAAIEGYSTYMQVELDRKQHIIADARNELEKAYGPLYTILNTFELGESKIFHLSPEDKAGVDKILATYPFMFPSEIYSFWLEKIREIAPSVGAQDLSPQDYEIPAEFRDKINKEYNRRVERYNKLLNRVRI